MTESGDTYYYYYLSTVNANMDYYTHAEIEGTEIARNLQHPLGWPSDKKLKNALSKNLIINWQVLSDDVRCAHASYGPDTDILKGKTARKNPKHIEFKQRIPIQE